MPRAKRTNVFARAVLIIYAIFMIFCLSGGLNAHAVDEVPNNAPVYSEGGESSDPDKPAKPNANDVFSGAEVGADSTGFSDDIGNLLSKVTNFIIKTCNYLFAFALIIHFAVESLMMAFPIFATLMSTKVPVQLFSNECAKVCGVKYSYKAGGGVGSTAGGVGSADASGGVGSAGGSDGKKNTFLGKFTVYFKERMFTVIICGALLVAAATGILPWIVNTAINWLLGLIFK